MKNCRVEQVVLRCRCFPVLYTRASNCDRKPDKTPPLDGDSERPKSTPSKPPPMSVSSGTVGIMELELLG